MRARFIADGQREARARERRAACAHSTGVLPCTGVDGVVTREAAASVVTTPATPPARGAAAESARDEPQ
jgi:hypothetical protein